MIRKTTIFLLALSCGAGAAFANPAPARIDPRIQYQPYNQNAVYKLDLYLKTVTAVQFSDSETVKSILIGDSASWEVVRLNSGNVVSIKPIVAPAATDMTIYTDSRVYTFELRSLGDRPDGAGEVTPLRTVFTYPDTKPKTAAGTPVPMPIDANYMVSGQAPFRPVWVQDDGRQTSFFLAEGAPRPAIFKVGPKRQEQLINSRTEGNRIIVDGTSDYWVLRIGDDAVCVGRTSVIRPGSTNSAVAAPKEVSHVE
jgi:type IV secretion system protein VirB9